MSKYRFKIVFCSAVALWLTLMPRVQVCAQGEDTLSLVLQDVELAEVMEMLSRKERVNILLSKDVGGEVSVNLYDVTLDQAIRSITNAAGYAVEHRNGTYFVVKREDAGKYATSSLTQLRTFKVEYSDPVVVEEILESYLSEYGKMTILPERNLLVVEDLPGFLKRIENLLLELDREPKQILIEAKILEVTLRESETFGLDWAKLFRSNGGEGAFGVRGLSNPISPGLFFNLVNPNVEIFLDALETRGRLRTLSTPKLLALENQEAEAVIGDRLGFRVTTTINQVTTESVEFLESGVILKVKPSVDGQGRVMLEIHPEVSTGTISDDGLPNQTTTEVTTRMLVEHAQTVFIGGLIRRTLDENREGVPVLGDIPLVSRLFSNRARNSVNTETIVLITPYILDKGRPPSLAEEASRVNRSEQDLEKEVLRIESKFDDLTQERAVPKSTLTAKRVTTPFKPWK